jgi:hypothetical protein
VIADFSEKPKTNVQRANQITLLPLGSHPTSACLHVGIDPMCALLFHARIRPSAAVKSMTDNIKSSTDYSAREATRLIHTIKSFTDSQSMRRRLPIHALSYSATLLVTDPNCFAIQAMTTHFTVFGACKKEHWHITRLSISSPTKHKMAPAEAGPGFPREAPSEYKTRFAPFVRSLRPSSSQTRGH